jgi:hypothetical protein
MSTIKDYKKDHKDLYNPKTQPSIIDVPEISYVAVKGQGNPNDESGEYQKALEVMYGIQYTIKMSKKGTPPEGYFDYVVPPLESFWWLDDSEDWTAKSKYNWIAVIRLPEFVSGKVFQWACEEVTKKKKICTDKAYLLTMTEGLCVQCMHIGPYDDEPKTLALIDAFIDKNNFKKNITDKRLHHEIYLSDPRKTEPAKMKTILRIPVKL